MNVEWPEYLFRNHLEINEKTFPKKFINLILNRISFLLIKFFGVLVQVEKTCR